MLWWIAMPFAIWLLGGCSDKHPGDPGNTDTVIDSGGGVTGDGSCQGFSVEGPADATGQTVNLRSACAAGFRHYDDDRFCLAEYRGAGQPMLVDVCRQGQDHAKSILNTGAKVSRN
jgi:hypothetical protein